MGKKKKKKQIQSKLPIDKEKWKDIQEELGKNASNKEKIRRYTKETVADPLKKAVKSDINKVKKGRRVKPKKGIDNLLKFVKGYKKAGFSKEEIKENLKDCGVNREIIDKSIEINEKIEEGDISKKEAKGKILHRLMRGTKDKKKKKDEFTTDEIIGLDKAQ